MNRNDQKFLVQKIRTQYTEKEHTQLDALKELDRKVKRPANVFSYIFGSISAIIMGAGMSLIMTDIGAAIGLGNAMIPGIAIGVVGLVLAIINYPIHKNMLGVRRKKYADQIIAFSDSIIHDRPFYKGDQQDKEGGNAPMSDHFEFTYSAKQQEEVKKIRQKYVPREEDKLEQLRKLDASVTRKGTMASLILGILSSLVMGIGMCCCLVWGESLFVTGIVIGLVGIAGVVLAYPVYTHITIKERQRLAPEILRLADELMQ